MPRGSAAAPLRAVTAAAEAPSVAATSSQTADAAALAACRCVPGLGHAPVTMEQVSAPVAEDMDVCRQNLLNVVGERHPMLLAAANQIFSAGGKRLRPLIVLLVARATYPLTGLRCVGGLWAEACGAGCKGSKFRSEASMGTHPPTRTLPLDHQTNHQPPPPAAATSRSGTAGWQRSRRCCTPPHWCTTTCWTSATRGEVRPACFGGGGGGCGAGQPASQRTFHPVSQSASWPARQTLGWSCCQPLQAPATCRGQSRPASPVTCSAAHTTRASRPPIPFPPPLRNPLLHTQPPAGKETVNSLYGTRVAVLAGDFLFAQSSWFLANLDNMEVGGWVGGCDDGCLL